MPRVSNPIQLQKFLSGVNYPVHKKDLVAHAKKHGADEDAVYTLERLPDREYDGPTVIAKEVGKLE